LDIDFQGIVEILRKLLRHSSLSSSSLLFNLSTILFILETSSRWTIHLRKYTPSFFPAVLTPRALFENYDQDLKQLISSLKGKLEGDVKQLKGGMSSVSPGLAALMSRTTKVCAEEGVGGA
jgi:hypothetical protein